MLRMNRTVMAARAATTTTMIIITTPKLATSGSIAALQNDSASSSDQATSGKEAGKAKKQKLEIPDKEFTLEDIAKHNTKEDCRVSVNGMALNVTDFLDNHPGGPKAILLYRGKDATKEFNMLHDKNVIEV